MGPLRIERKPAARRTKRQEDITEASDDVIRTLDCIAASLLTLSPRRVVEVMIAPSWDVGYLVKAIVLEAIYIRSIESSSAELRYGQVTSGAKRRTRDAATGIPRKSGKKLRRKGHETHEI